MVNENVGTEDLMHVFSVTNVWTNFMSALEDIKSIREQLGGIQHYLALILVAHIAWIILITIIAVTICCFKCFKSRTRYQKSQSASKQISKLGSLGYNNDKPHRLTFSRLLPSNKNVNGPRPGTAIGIAATAPEPDQRHNSIAGDLAKYRIGSLGGGPGTSKDPIGNGPGLPNFGKAQTSGAGNYKKSLNGKVSE